MKSETPVVYTCIAGNYDSALMDVSGRSGTRFVCFTDNPARLKAPGWEMVALQSPVRLTSGHDINRYHKLFPHRVFPDTRWSIYIDGNQRFDGDFEQLVALTKQRKAAIGAFWHPDGHNLREEVRVCGLSKFDDRDFGVVDRQFNLYVGRGIDPEARIPENSLLVRDHEFPNLDRAMSLWWSQLFEFTKRDQISLTYVLNELDIPWTPLDEGQDRVDASLLYKVRHNPPSIAARARRRLGLIKNRLNAGN